MSGPKKTRLDARLVELGLIETRAKAQAAIMAGLVLVDGQTRDKPGVAVSAQAEVILTAPLKYVSRGGLKLEGALDHFRLDPGGKVCLDVGASTGGFTDCLLQRGAARVYCVDVGKGLLDFRLRNDPRVTLLEEINARYLEPALIPAPIELATIDVSFISLELVLPAVTPLLAEGGAVLALVKPQFEVGRERVGKGGVVRDPAVQLECVEKISAFARERLGLVEQGRCPAPIKGPKGNQEYFLLLAAPP